MRHAFDSAVKPLLDQMTGYAFNMLHDFDAADEAVADALLKAWRAFPRFRGESTFKTWIFAILKNTAIDTRRWRSARPVTVAEVVGREPRSPFGPRHGRQGPEVRDGRVGPEDVVAIRLDLARALDALDPDMRQAVLLVAFGLKDKEAGEILGVGRQTVLRWRRTAKTIISAMMAISVDDAAAIVLRSVEKEGSAKASPHVVLGEEQST